MDRKIALFGIAMALFAASASASNIVMNGNFLTGDLTDWSTNALVFFGVVPFPASPPDAGTVPVDTGFAASSRCSGASCNDPVLGSWISQSLPTLTGQTYTLTFLYDVGSPSTGGSQTTELDVRWNGSLAASGQIIDATFNHWQQYTFTGLTATGSSTVLEFTGRQDPESLFLTDISVSSSGVSRAPEPASLLLMGVGLLGVGLLRLRCKA